ncbi:MAG: caspase family protein, partial [Parachlamydia sp.]|nr:caspase family protein [Parachlamydia sp.]
MTIPVIALIIGISNYQSKDFQQLPAAQSDASKLARFLLEMGIPEDNIFLLNSSFVTTEQFAKRLEHFSSIKTPFQLLFYFCGHGYRTEGESPESYLIFSDTQSYRDGVSLETLHLNFLQMKATGIYLFLDACSLRLNSLANPKYFAEIQGEQANKTLFCLLSSG